MKLPKKNIPFALAVLGAAFFASATAFAGPPARPAATDLPQYMVHSANLGNASYMACIRGKVKRPAEVNVLSNFDVAIDCQKELKL
jgi:hypothetical protein